MADPADEFRWQAFFQRARDPLFVLNRRRRLLFVNRAWESLTGLSAIQVRGLACTRRKPAEPGPAEEIVVHLLCPPTEVHLGQSCRARRLFPGGPTTRRWWDVEFFPLRDDQGLLGILGKVTVVAASEPGTALLLPENLVVLRESVARRHAPSLLASNVPSLRRVAEQVRLASQTRACVLITGEPGTGKHWLARAIHFHSELREKTFVALDCHALPADALAAVLFGDGTPGRAVPAGTVYLSEPSALPRDQQARLCSLLPGPGAPRLLAGSSVDIAAEMRAGRLLEEFHCALSPLVIALPPLRDRLADLPDLVDRFLDRANESGEPRLAGLSKEALDVMHAYRWPGNLRELYAVLQSARLHTRGDRIGVAHLPAPVRLAVRLEQTPVAAEERPLALDKVLEEAERRLILLALKKARGNQSKAAELLSIWRPRLLRRMKALGIADPETS